MTLGLPANFLFEVMKRYLQAQGVMIPLAVVMAVGCAVNVRQLSFFVVCVCLYLLSLSVSRTLYNY